uniref:Tyrosine-protein kinase n=1 Tax=Caenorhabditis tropicalis TaxID=1561998 RepID=A0A1I7TLW9_9PELO
MSESSRLDAQNVSTSSSQNSTADEEKLLKTANGARKHLSEYYKKQNEILDHYKQDSEQIEAARRTRERHRSVKTSESSESAELYHLHASTITMQSKDSLMVRHEDAQNEEAKLAKAATRLANITLLVNLCLMLAKMIASYLSGSMSIISSMVDSVVDLTAGAVLSISSRMIRKRDPYQYPRGRTRVEPLSLILISVIMGMASVQLIISSTTRISAAAAGGDRDEINVSWPTIGIMLSTIIVKLTLFIVCQKYKSNSSIKVLSLDHRNDCLSISMTLSCAWLAYTYGSKNGQPTGVSLFGICPESGCDLYYLDPFGAIVVSFYILYTWIRTGYAHFVMLSGKSAHPELINRIIHQCIEHDERITHIDTVYVYHYGTKFLVETTVAEREDFPEIEKKLREFAFYHGFLPREDLQSILVNPGDYLIRVSEVVESENKFTREVILSLMPITVESKLEEDKNRPRNVVIKHVQNMVFCELNHSFDTMTELIAYYTENTGAYSQGLFQLVTPILQQPWEFMHSDVQVGKVLGEGAFGKVCAGQLKLKDGTNVEVAIKMTKVSAFLSKAKIKEMMNEARFIRNFNHKNVVRLYGVAHDEQPLYILLELVKGGSLQDYLKKAKEEGETVSVLDRINFCAGAGKGIDYLHQNNCIHRNDGNEFLIEDNKREGDDLYVIANAIVKVDASGRTMLHIFNPSATQIKIWKDQALGRAEKFVNTRQSEYIPPEAEPVAKMPKLPKETPANYKPSQEVDLSKSILNDEEKEVLKEIVDRHPRAFVGPDGNLGCYTGQIRHRIDFIEGAKIPAPRNFRVPLERREEAAKQIEEMLRQDLIRESKSPMASPIVLVPKADKESWRFCIDYRQINTITEPVQSVLPNIQELLDITAESCVYTTLDFAAGFHQIPVVEEHCERTAFASFMGVFEFVRMPMGLKGSSGTFQRVMYQMLRPLKARVFCYIDDIILTSRNTTEHLQDIDEPE